MKVIKKIDNKIRKELKKNNNYCNDKCIVRKLTKGVECRTRGCVYELECQECYRKYRGQTGQSIQTRTNEHFEDWKRGEDKSPLHRHSQLFHDGKRFPLSIKILKKCYGNPTGRKIAEAVLIDELSSNQTMKGKSEWTYVKLNKVSTLN